MRRSLLIALSATVLVTGPAMAQPQQRPNTGDEANRQQAESRRRAAEWNDRQLPIIGSNAAGPCPFVKVLYDAARTIEFAGGTVAAANVGFTGEMEGVTSRCSYQGDEPIQLELMVTFSAGKGPQAQGNSHQYGYWVAVTTRNSDIIAKEQFGKQVVFPNNEDRVLVSDHIANIVIPRASATTSGAAFEVLVGFNVNAEQAEFNRSGNRFRVDAGGAVAAAGTPAAQ